MSILPLVLQQVTFTAGGKRLLKEISCRLTAGRTSIVLGPNGAGKSLLMRLCHGLLAPTSGHLRWHGAGGEDVRRHQAMVFQRPVMLRRSVSANIDYALAAHGVGRRERQLRTAEMLDRAGLRRRARYPARVLSGGEQQKLALARAWALRPQILFLDEPTASLDPGETAAFEQMIGTIEAEGTKIVMTTHDLAQARRLAGEVLFLLRGRLLEQTEAALFFQGPHSPEAAAFLEGKLLLKPRKENMHGR